MDMDYADEYLLSVVEEEVGEKGDASGVNWREISELFRDVAADLDDEKHVWY